MILIRMVTAADCPGLYVQLESRYGIVYNFFVDMVGEECQKLNRPALQVSFVFNVHKKKLK